jgi:hypothetical protein
MWGSLMEVTKMFKVTTPLLIAGFFLLLLPSIANGLDEDCVLYYSFDNDEPNLVKDESGKGHDGDIFGVKQVDGKFGKAYQFGSDEGMDEQGDFVQTLPHKDFSFKGGEGITCMAWFLKSEATEFGAIIYNRPEENRCNFGFRFELNGISWFYRDKGDAEWEGVQTADTVKRGEWTHAAATNTFGGGLANMKVYVNGKIVEKQIGWGTGGALDPFSIEGPVDIGGRWEGQSHLFSGIIDEPSIWRRALTEAEINEAMNDPLSVFLAVQPKDKLATTWSALKQSRH